MATEGGDWDAEQMKQIPFYFDLTTDQATCLLKQGGAPGTFLLRPSTKPGSVGALSVRFHDSVKHITIDIDANGIFMCGENQFRSLIELSRYLIVSEHEVTLSDSSVLLLKKPFTYETKQISQYEKSSFTRRSVVPNFDSFNPPPPPSSNDGVEALAFAQTADSLSREGCLLKRGHFNTAWKKRWFKLNRDGLAYYKHLDSQLRGTILYSNIKEVVSCTPDDTGFHFNITTPERVYFLTTESEANRDNWIRCIKHKLTVGSGGSTSSTASHQV